KPAANLRDAIAFDKHHYIVDSLPGGWVDEMRGADCDAPWRRRCLSTDCRRDRHEDENEQRGEPHAKALGHEPGDYYSALSIGRIVDHTHRAFARRRFVLIAGPGRTETLGCGSLSPSDPIGASHAAFPGPRARRDVSLLDERASSGDEDGARLE